MFLSILKGFNTTNKQTNKKTHTKTTTKQVLIVQWSKPRKRDCQFAEATEKSLVRRGSGMQQLSWSQRLNLQDRSARNNTAPYLKKGNAQKPYIFRSAERVEGVQLAPRRGTLLKPGQGQQKKKPFRKSYQKNSTNF